MRELRKTILPCFHLSWMSALAPSGLRDPSIYHLHSASDIDTVSNVPGKAKPKRRSGCPVSISLDLFGDRWSLLIVRDLMVRGLRTFKEFQQSGEGIATNILADRLRKLEAAGIITAELEKKDGRRVNYRLAEKGIDLAPVLLDLLIWGGRHEKTGASCALIVKMEKNRDEILAEARRRWRERDSTPLIPKFRDRSAGRSLVRTQSSGRSSG
jgi:DNA-binding HxlR family transcriptional regulator